MKGITYYELRTNLSELQEIYQLEITQKINEHATCYITGVLKEETKDSSVTETLEGKEIKVYTSQSGENILFRGLIQMVKIIQQGQLYMIEITGISNSYLTDIKKKSASYQNIEASYHSIIQKVIKNYPKGAVKDLASKGANTGQLIVQYKETDWEFLKRLASHFNMGLLPNITLEGPKFFFGTYEGVNRGEIKCHEYTAGKDLLRYQKCSQNTFSELQEEDILTYSIDILENYDVGDKVTYQNHALYIQSKRAVLIADMLHFQYQLCGKNGLGTERIYHEGLVGLSLKGSVLESVKDKVKVHLEIDPEQSSGETYLFPYTTMYTAEGQSGWYCMPEVGDTVLVHFPSHDEAQALSMNSYRRGGGADKINDPAVKYFRTANGKELKFSPDEIVITCIQEGDQVVYIKLNQDNGIEIMSSEPIAITTDKSISIEAEEQIEIAAKESITLRCKQSQIKMDGKIDICGPDVRINNGRKRNEVFTSRTYR